MNFIKVILYGDKNIGYESGYIMVSKEFEQRMFEFEKLEKIEEIKSKELSGINSVKIKKYV